MSLLLLFHSNAAAEFISRYRLNSSNLPRPSRMTREFLFFKNDVRTISGKLGRDITGRKEKFTLYFDNLTKEELDDIITIIELNTSVAFEVNDRNFTIESRMVIPYLSEAEYNTPGSDFLSATVLELVEVE